MDKEKSLDLALANIEKQFGKGSLMRLGDQVGQEVPAIPSGAISLDLALGVGGLPRGRVVEIYGPESSGKTTVALHAVAEAQRLGGIAAFIDAEHALDPTYANAMGVDIDELLVSQPDTGEQALEIADMLVRSNAIDIVVIDSVAALVPRAEIEGEMGDSHVGLQARLMSQALRKLSGSLKKSNTCAVFINQLREKVGVMFGCASGRTRVTLADGSHESIASIVRQRLPLEVLSYDAEAGEVVPRRITNWFDNGRTEQFRRIVVARAGGGAGHDESHLEFTPNHLIMTPGGWREAGDLKVGDRVVQAVPRHLSKLQWEVLLGGLLGDSALSSTRSGCSARLRWSHGREQAAYGDWKSSLFANVDVSRTTGAKGSLRYDVQPLAELAELRRALYVGHLKVLSWEYLKQLTPLSLAIWYQDDGRLRARSTGVRERTRGGTGRIEICVEAFDRTSRRRLVEYLRDTWGIEGRLSTRGTRGLSTLTLGREATDEFQELVAPYVHPSMEHKLLPRFRGRFQVEPDFVEKTYDPVPMEILRIEDRPAPHEDDHRYDIEIDGTHNYFADGVMVHNSPETTPGGRALKFYASVRLDVRRIETLKDGADAVGNRVRVKVVKNKCVAAGTRVHDPVSGLTRPIEELAEADEGLLVWAADKTGAFHLRPVLGWFDQGEQPTIGLSLRDGTELVVTPDHRVLTEHGWREAGALAVGDRVARPRRVGGFGDQEPVAPHHARLLGYLIGDGEGGGRTPVARINVEEDLRADASRIAEELDCVTDVREDGRSASVSRRPGVENGVLELTRWAGIGDQPAPGRRIPAALLAPDVSAEVLGNLLFGIWESDGWISREQADGVRLGFVTTSEQLAWQLHWTLLRWGVRSSVLPHEPGSRRRVIAGQRVSGELPCWQVRVSGIDDVTRFSRAVPTWGPKGRELTALLEDPALARHRRARTDELPETQTGPVVEYLHQCGLTPTSAAAMIGEQAGDPRGGLRSVLGTGRLRRDRVERLAEALDSDVLRDVLSEELDFDRVTDVQDRGRRRTYDIEVEELHNFVADGVVVHNCAPPFRQAEFDIVYGEGISKQGSLIDVGVDEGIIRKAGAWYTYEGDQLGQGKENARAFLKEHTDVADEIEKRIKEKLGLDPLAAGEEPEMPSGTGEVADAEPDDEA